MAAEFVLCKNLISDSNSTDSSTSSDSESDFFTSDSELLLLTIKKKHYNIKNYVQHVIPLYTDLEFKSHFRISRSSVEDLLLTFQIKNVDIPGRPPIPVLNCLLLTLWTVSNQECFRSIADRFGISKGHAHKIFINLCSKISSYSNKYIQWPRGNQAIKTVEDFNSLRGINSFPNVFGCVDGTHIPIPGQKCDNSFYNRKGYYSILLQAVCNSQQEFINIYCGWPGSTHDARMWQNSTIYNHLNDDLENWLPPNTYLLGDSAYPLKKFIMVPFKDNGHLSRKQKKFNQKLSSTRVVIEQAYGRLKGLFRRLKYLHILKLQYAKNNIMTCCILHNISLKEGELYYEEIQEDEESDNDDDNVLETDSRQDTSAAVLRNE